MLHEKDNKIHKDVEEEKAKRVKQGEELLSVLNYYGLIDGGFVQDKFKIVCPFHNDLNASCQINLDSGTYFCYGCEAQGRPEDFVNNMEKGNSLHNMIIYNKALTGKSKSNIKIVRRKPKPPKELLEIADWYYYSLPDTDWNKITKSYMYRRGYNADVLNRVGAKINTNPSYKFIFPMYDNNKFRGYVCRTSLKELEKKRKYLYNEGFSRRNSLIGNYYTDWVVIVEGYMDWLRFRQFKVKNVCAIMGWKITEEQIEKLKKVTTKVISALDNTKTGRQGTELLRKHFEVVEFDFPENAKDPGDLDEYDFNFAWALIKEKIKKKEEKKDG